MRKVTKNIVGVFSLGVLATSWSIGQAAQTGLSLSASASDANATSTDSSTAAPAPVESSTPSASNTPATADPGSSSSAAAAKPTATPSPTKTSAPAPTATKSTSASSSQTGSAVPYKYGVIQVEVVKSGTKITAVNLVQSGTRGQEYAVVPGMLAEAAVAANGSSFGNVSGATFTTQAFKSALESALARF